VPQFFVAGGDQASQVYTGQ